MHKIRKSSLVVLEASLNILQIFVALGLLNVWLLRPKRQTPFRGGSARTLKEEFQSYGLPEFMFYLVGALKIGCAILLIMGLWVEALVVPAAAILLVLMLGALIMHMKVKDPLIKSVPALSVLGMSIALLLLSHA